MVFLVLLAVMSTTAVVLFGDFLETTLVPGLKASEYVVYPLQNDRQGSVYRVQVRKEHNELVAIDSVGNEFINRALPELGDETIYSITHLFLTENRTILVAAMKKNRNTETVSEISLHRYHDDGSYAGELLRIPCDQSIADTLFTGLRFSEFSQSDDRIWFSLLAAGETKDRIEVYQLGTEESAQPEKVADYLDPGYVSFLPLDDKQAVGALHGGNLEMRLANGNIRSIVLENVAAVGRLWAGDGIIYLQNLDDMNLYQMTMESRAAALLMNGDARVLEGTSEKLALADCDLVSVSAGGVIAALQTNGSSANIYVGGSRYLHLLEEGVNGFNTDYFWVGAIVLGVLLLTLAAWDIYAGLFKGRVSIMIKQAVVVPLCAMLMLYGLLRGVLQPSMEKALRQQNHNRMHSVAQIVTAALERLDKQKLFDHQWNISEKNGIAPIHFDLFVQQDGEWILQGSSDSAQVNMSAAHIPFHAMIPLMLDECANNDVHSLRVYSYFGFRQYCMTELSDGRILSLWVSEYQMRDTLDGLIGRVSWYLLLIGGGLVIALLLLQYAQVRGLRRLKRSVDQISAGAYDVEIRISSGDEVESLANSFNVMTRFIRTQLAQLERMHDLSYRFVPRALLRLLGDEGLEKINRNTHIQCRMTVLLAQFDTGKKTSISSDRLFADINHALERLTPAVAKNGGTLYDFNYDGFCAVFDGQEEQAVRAALQIRESAMSPAGGETPLDVRVVLVTGDVLLGVIGNEERLQPMAVSQAVSTATALIGMCRDSNIYIAGTNETLAALSEYRCRYVGLVKLPDGCKTPLYDLYNGDPYALRKHKESVEKVYDSAVKSFYEQDYQRARTLFMQILKLSLEDGAARGYLYLADKYCAEGCEDPVYKPFA